MNWENILTYFANVRRSNFLTSISVFLNPESADSFESAEGSGVCKHWGKQVWYNILTQQ